MELDGFKFGKAWSSQQVVRLVSWSWGLYDSEKYFHDTFLLN